MCYYIEIEGSTHQSLTCRKTINLQEGLRKQGVENVDGARDAKVSTRARELHKQGVESVDAARDAEVSTRAQALHKGLYRLPDRPSATPCHDCGALSCLSRFSEIGRAHV